MKKQIITVLVLGAIAAMPFSAAVSAAESAQWRKYTTRAKQRAAEEAAAKEEKDKEAALARQKAEEVLSNEPLWKRYTSRGKAAREALAGKGLTGEALGTSTGEEAAPKRPCSLKHRPNPWRGEKKWQPSQQRKWMCPKKWRILSRKRPKQNLWRNRKSLPGKSI